MKRPRCRFLFRGTALATVYVCLSLYALVDFVRYPGTEACSHCRLGAMVYGAAYRPYVTRVLVPLAARAAVASMPGSVRTAVVTHAEPVLAGLDRRSYPEGYPFEFSVVLAVLLLCLLGFALALRRLAAVTLGMSGLRLDAVPALGLLLLPGFYAHASHIYDFPTLFLFTARLVALAERNWTWYAPMFALATLNKETSLLLTMVWALVVFKELPRRRFVRYLLLQIGFWILIRGALAFAFGNNPGSLLDFTLPRNLQVLARTDSHFSVRLAAGLVPVTRGLHFLVLAAAALAAYWSRRAPVFLRKCLLVSLPLVGLVLLFGYVDELRVYYELYPAGFLVLLDGFYRLMGYSERCPRR